VIHAVSLFDESAVMLEPWRDAGHTCWAVDLLHPRGVTERDGVNLVHHDLTYPWLPPFDRDDIVFVAAFPPCDHLAVSGARWFRGKGLRALASSIELCATGVEWCEWSGAAFLLEQPVSVLASHWRKPDYYCHPWEYAGFEPSDHYSKRTCLWTGGGFVMPPPFPLEGAGEPDDRIHKMPPSADRAALRSLTPRGFARAVFEANKRG
tara:strand:- start:4590 stop:5210 length:621 start_codon:yes stop_codon:yes gene_type:complete